MSGWRGKRRDREDPWFLFHHTWSSSWCWRIPLPKVFHPNKGNFDHHGLFHRADTPNATSTLRMLRFTLSSKQEVHLSLSALRCSTHSNLSRLWMWRVMTWEPPWPPRSPGWNTSSGLVGPTMAPISGPRLVIRNGYQPCLIFAKKNASFQQGEL